MLRPPIGGWVDPGAGVGWELLRYRATSAASDAAESPRHGRGWRLPSTRSSMTGWQRRRRTLDCRCPRSLDRPPIERTRSRSTTWPASSMLNGVGTAEREEWGTADDGR